MSPIQTKQLSEKISRLEDKLDIVIRHIIFHHQTETDWIENPALTPLIKETIAKAESDISAGRVRKAEEIFKKLGV